MILSNYTSVIFFLENKKEKGKKKSYRVSHTFKVSYHGIGMS